MDHGALRQRRHPDIRTVIEIENRLRPVAMVNIDLDDRDTSSIGNACPVDHGFSRAERGADRTAGGDCGPGMDRAVTLHADQPAE